ncbi:MAG: phosphoribosyltransferase family protein [Bacteroidales bacterium]
MRLLHELGLLFFPAHCLSCGKRLASHKVVLCLTCEGRLPRFRFDEAENNPVCRVFWGRVRITGALSLVPFVKGGMCQTLLHEFKYKNCIQVGLHLGSLLGHSIGHTPLAAADLLLPVPLHRKKEKKRGYNQSEILARACGSVLGIPVETRVLLRKDHGTSQTTMSRYERYENVRDSFNLSPGAPDLDGKTLLLIDDVLTTGATLEACAEILLAAFDCKVHVATLAYACEATWGTTGTTGSD